MIYPIGTKLMGVNWFGKCIVFLKNKWCRLLQEKYLDSNDCCRILIALDPPKGSAIWDFMISSRDAILRFVSWEVNNGESINFWIDSWNGLPPLSQNLELANAVQTITNCWGSKLIDYVSVVDIHSGKAMWKDPSDLLITLLGKLLSTHFIGKSCFYF